VQPADTEFRWKIHDRLDPRQIESQRDFSMSLPGLTYTGIFTSRYSSGTNHSWWYLQFYKLVPITCIFHHGGRLPVRYINPATMKVVDR
jgi:hypothetical protein